jgi:phage gp45-like
MNRNSLLETAGRVFHVIQRFTLNDHNDDPMMQTLHLDGMNSESRKNVERVQPYGFTSAPLPRDQSTQQPAPQSKGVGGPGESPKGPAAEGICVYLGGQRNHPVCIAIDDRRHRPMSLKPGENAQYDDIGQMTLIRRDATHMLSLDSKDANGNLIKRFASLRHVNKQKQQRPQSQQQQAPAGSAPAPALRDGTSQPAASGGQNYKHEGDTVNHETRVTTDRIELRSGDQVMGYYDRPSTTWHFNAATAVQLVSDGTVLIQCGTHLIKAGLTVVQGVTKLGATTDGGAEVDKQIGIKGSVDSAGHELIGGLATGAYAK